MSPRYFPQERTQYGFWAALERLGRRRHLPLIGYLVLALGIGGAFAVDHEHFSAANSKIEHVLVDSCQRGNKLRVVLRDLVLQELPNVDREVALGRLTKKEALAARILIRKDANKVGPVPCSVVLRLK